MSNFWPIVCFACGSNCDLLTDKHTRVLCRECLNLFNFKEVESTLRDFDEEESNEEL